MRLMFATLLAGFCLGCGSGGKSQPAQDDKDKLQGTWTVTSCEIDGRAEKEMVGAKLTIVGDKVTVQPRGGEKNEGTFKVNTAKKPKELDMDLAVGKEKMGVSLGIYELDGDTLKLCQPRPGSKERPTEFKSKAEVALIVLKRDKP